MIHAVCDVCGTECDRVGYFITVQGFQNFARYHSDTEVYGSTEKKVSIVMCQKCLDKNKILNPYRINRCTVQGVAYGDLFSLDTMNDNECRIPKSSNK